MAEQWPIIASSVIRAIDIIGDRWTLYILRDAFLGSRRYFEWKTRLKISDAVLSDRLRKLVGAGCLAKQQSSTSETHEEYYLTDQGLGLYHVLICLWHWDTSWNPNRERTTRLVHHTCGEATVPIVACGHCKEPVRARDIEFAEGAGVGIDNNAPVRRRRTRKSDPLDIVGNEALTILGDRWSALLVACSFLGLRRFKELQARMGIPPHQLSVRLKELVAGGILERSLYQEHPPRHEYRLTGKGRDFYPVILMLMVWGDRWLSQPDGPPVILRHRPCGVVLDPVMNCGDCGKPIDRRNVYLDFSEESEAVV